jgi:hypothetical protein
MLIRCQIHGGVLETFENATFIVVDPTPGVLDETILDRVGPYQAAVNLKWVEDSVAAGVVQPYLPYVINRQVDDDDTIASQAASTSTPAPPIGVISRYTTSGPSRSTAFLNPPDLPALSIDHTKATSSHTVPVPAAKPAPLQIVVQPHTTSRSHNARVKHRLIQRQDEVGSILTDKPAAVQRLIDDLHKWCRRGCPGSRTAFLNDLDRKQVRYI